MRYAVLGMIPYCRITLLGPYYGVTVLPDYLTILSERLYVVTDWRECCAVLCCSAVVLYCTALYCTVQGRSAIVPSLSEARCSSPSENLRVWG